MTPGTRAPNAAVCGAAGGRRRAPSPARGGGVVASDDRGFCHTPMSMITNVTDGELEQIRRSIAMADTVPGAVARALFDDVVRLRAVVRARVTPARDG